MMNKVEFFKFLKRYSIITLGCIIYSLAVSLFLDANNIASGGVTGIAIVVNYIIETFIVAEGQLPPIAAKLLDTGTLIIIFNIPMFILGAIYFGKKFILSTLYSTIMSSLLINLWDLTIVDKLNLTSDLLISGVIGGALFGIGIGLIFRMGSTTGGTDVIVKILRKKFRYIKTGMISMIIDIIIVGVSNLVYKDFNLTCYTFLALAVIAFMFDLVLYGGNSAKLVYIITTPEKAELMEERILKELDVGATYLEGKGAYTGKDKCIIMCAIKNIMYPKLRDVVRDCDPQAFTIMTSAKEIYGEGYQNPTDDEL